jgi:arylsulfatase A-like enzyme
MVISGPGIAGGRKVDGMCHIMDLCPTICDLAGVPAPQALDARSLKPALANPGTPLRTEVIAAFRHFQRAVRTDRWKLILYNVEGKRVTQLYDLREDPLEMKNLASEAGQSGRIRELKALMQQRLREAGDHVDLNGEWTP